MANIDIPFGIHLDDVIAVTISFVLHYNNINLTEEETNKMINELLKNNNFIEALKNMVK